MNETYFPEKFDISRYLTSKLSKFGCFLTIRHVKIFDIQSQNWRFQEEKAERQLSSQNGRLRFKAGELEHMQQDY